jgi:hypothetical protein
MSLTATSTKTPTPILFCTLLGLLSAIILGAYIHYKSSRIDLSKLLVLSATLMLLLSSSLAGGLAEQLGFLPQIIWDVSSCCDESSQPIFRFLNGVVGWRAKPSVGSFITYMSYWIAVYIFVDWGVNKRLNSGRGLRGLLLGGIMKRNEGEPRGSRRRRSTWWNAFQSERESLMHLNDEQEELKHL